MKYAPTPLQPTDVINKMAWELIDLVEKELPNAVLKIEFKYLGDSFVIEKGLEKKE